MTHKNRIVGALCFVMALVVSSLQADKGSLPIEFSTPTVDGQVFDLAQFRGSWVVVNFWATWCKPCRKEMPEFSDLHAQRDDINVIGLAFEEVEPEAIRAFLEDYPVSYPIAVVDVYDPPEVFGVPRVLPTTLIISPAGLKVKTFLGPVTREMLEGYIDTGH